MTADDLTVPFPPLATLYKIGLALGMGLFVGLEREWRHKEAGLRTFGFAAMLGALGGLLGPPFALLSVALLGIPVAFLNCQAIRTSQTAELTTSTALLVTGFVGVLCGTGHTFTPVAIAVMTAGLLAWKEQLAGFSLGLTVLELRGAILLAILAFIVYPILPRTALDPWGLVQLRAAWVTVILIAGIGFGNYVLLKMFGPRGVQVTGFLGGLVNSTVTTTELALRDREAGGRLSGAVFRGVLLATCAMALRSAVLLGILDLDALLASFLPLTLVLLSSLLFGARDLGRDHTAPAEAPSIPLSSPFSLQSALKFGLLFILLQVVGSLAQEWLGQGGFYVVSFLSGLISSASSVASAAVLASQGRITPAAAGIGAVLASMASALTHLAVVARLSHDRVLTLRVARALCLVVVLCAFRKFCRPDSGNSGRWS